MSSRRFALRAVTIAVSLSLMASEVSAVPAPDNTRSNAPAVQRERSVPGWNAPAVQPVAPLARAGGGQREVQWPAAGRAEVDAKAAGKAGSLPVAVALAGADQQRAKAAVAVETFDRAAARKAGVAGVLLKVSDAGGAAGAGTTVRLDYTGFAGAFGGDYGSRLAFSRYPSCVLTTPEKPDCRVGTPLPSHNDGKAKQVATDVNVPQGGDAVVLAAAAGAAGSGGDYSATSLAPSGSWSSGGSSGDFGYSMPLTMPVAPGGPVPSLDLAYSSGSVDGRTSATNNQASWVGDGWELSAGGTIERQYTACADDEGGNQGTLKSGDLCWKDEKYTISLGGISGKMVKDSATGALRPERDDGSRIERLTGAVNGDNDGEYWKVTVPDGTQYFLGLNRLPGWADGKPTTNSVFTVPVYGNHAGEPCNKTAFADSSCTQAYRWNVDLVVDPHGNAMTFYYDHEINHYKRGGLHGTNTAYVAAGRLNRIEYGLRADAPYATAVAKVSFLTAERCLPSGAITCDPAQLTEANAASWPDVPFDRLCAAGEDCTYRFSPAFFSRKRLTEVKTESHNGSQYVPVDSWVLRQEFPPTGDGNPKSLWLAGVKRIGHVGGTAEMPEVQFTGLPMDNRVDAQEGLLPITRYRVTRVVNEAGGLTEVIYAPHDCDRATRMPANPESNTYRCFPTYWTPPGEDKPVLDWFHKYVVAGVTEDSRTGGPSQLKMEYQYLDGAAWHYDDNYEEDADKRTWSQWRGFGKVRTLKGDPSGPRTVSESLFLRGMDGDTLPGGGTRDVWVTDGDGGRIEDERRLQGFTRETLLYDGDRVVSATVSEPHLIETANDGKDPAYLLRVKGVATRSLQEDGTWRKTRSTTSFNAIGQPERIENEGDTAVSGDESCSTTTYLRNDSAWMLTYASSVRQIAKPCAQWPGTDADVVSDVRSLYDGQPYGTAPTRGVVTESQRWLSGTTYQTVTTTKVDAYGRTIESTDVDGAKTTTTYTPGTGNPTSIATTNRAGWVTTSEVDSARGLPLAEVGVNGERSDLLYDPLGRLSKVWVPGRSKATQTPNAEYTYEYHSDTPTVVTSKALRENGTYAVSYDLYDGSMRLRQSQTPALNGGRLITDNFYDSRGNTYKVNGAYYNADAPSGSLFGVYDNEVPNQTVTEFDNLGRPTETILKIRDVEQWRTKTRYGGDNTYTTPPKGGTATAVIKDARGAIVERRQYHSRSSDGVYTSTAKFDATKYAYNTKGALAKVTDTLGNAWSYEYDLLGRKAADTDPDHGRTTYAYDNLDQLTSTTDARGKTLTYTYDALGRKTATYDGTTKLSEWAYDTLRKGALTSSKRFVGGNTYEQRVDQFDAIGRPTRTSVVIPANEGKLAGTYTFGASYSAITGQLLSETTPAMGGLSAENIIHTYNAEGQALSTYGQNTYASEHTYSPYGETLRVTLGASPNKVWVNSTYTEGTRRLDNVLVKRDSTTEPEAANRAFTYDAMGNVTKLSNKPLDGPADTQCFTYDFLRRMTSAWTPKSGSCTTTKSVANLGGPAPYWQDFTFDKIGNRATKVDHKSTGDVTETYEVPAAGTARPHTVTSVTRAGPNGTAKDEFTYDQAGNTATRKIGGNTQTLDWNAEGRVEKVTEADGAKSEYVYNADGARLIKREPAGNTLYLPGHELYQAAGATTTTAKRYYSHGGESVAMRGSVSGLQYILGDHHGTDDLSIYAENLYVTRRYTDPFGIPRAKVPSFWPDDKGLVGGVQDTTGLTSIGAREYDPTLGRFISVDPVMDLAEPQQIHGYAYGRNAPPTFWDPTGLAECADVDCLYIDAVYAPLSPKKQEEMRNYYDRQEKEKNKRKGATQQVAKEMGMSEKEMQRLKEEAESKKGFWDVMKEELPDIIGDLTGYNDLRDCFTKFDLWACASIIPWGKVLKLARSATKIFNAVRKALKWEERVLAARAKLHKWRERVEELVRKGEDKVDDIAERAQAAPDCVKHSFPPGTRVMLGDGSSKAIEDVALGDRVLASDPVLGRTGEHQVVATHKHDQENTRTELSVAQTGLSGSAVHKVVATDWHPFWVASLGKWVPAAEIPDGAWLQTGSGTWVQVVGTRSVHGAGRTYDLTVSDLHSYYVLAGGTSLLAHNCESELELKYKDDWTEDQRAAADKKVADLNGNSLVVTKPKRRRSASETWARAGLRKRSGEDIDHIHDLQLGGADSLENMAPLDSSVNRSLGSQIAKQIKKKRLRPGDIVCKISISERC